MSATVAQRSLALAAAALLAVVLGLALSDRFRSDEAKTALPRPVLGPGAGWYRALAGVADGRARRRSACGALLGPKAFGIAHPVLPCRTKIFVAFGRKRALTQVIDRGPRAGGRAFDLTPALARELGLRGVQPVRWAFARP